MNFTLKRQQGVKRVQKIKTGKKTKNEITICESEILNQIQEKKQISQNNQKTIIIFEKNSKRNQAKKERKNVQTIIESRKTIKQAKHKKGNYAIDEKGNKDKF